MLRLTTPDNLRIQQSRDFLVNYGGSEANVAISIANFGGEVEYITRLPDNALGETCIAELRSHNIGTKHILFGELRSHNIGTKHILFGGHRLGTYYMEKAAAMRNSNVIYDRENSSFSELKPRMINWREIFKDAAIFHWSGIDAALTPGLAEVCKEAIDIAKEMGLTISYDINYRKNLWNYGKTAQEVLRPLMTSTVTSCSEVKVNMLSLREFLLPASRPPEAVKNTIPQRMRSSVRKSASRFQTANTSTSPCAM